MSLIITESINYANSRLNTKWTQDKWANSTYQHVKEASNTEKGSWGEHVTAQLLTRMGYPTEIINGGIGDYDLQCDTLRIEHKLATLDSMEKFQFNNIDKDKDYDFIWCLGVAPNKLYVRAANRQWICNNLTTEMSKAGGGFKWSVPKSQMFALTEYQAQHFMDSMIKQQTKLLLPTV